MTIFVGTLLLALTALQPVLVQTGQKVPMYGGVPVPVPTDRASQEIDRIFPSIVEKARRCPQPGPGRAAGQSAFLLRVGLGPLRRLIPSALLPI